MGIKSLNKMSRSKYIGMSWMILSLFAATFAGIVAQYYFEGINLKDSELIFIEMVKGSFTPFFAGLALCAIIAAIINVMSSQMLVLSSILSEDFYKKFNKNVSDKKLLIVSRIGILAMASTAVFISSIHNTSIFSLVLYAWSGLGASFGPLLIQCLLFKKINRYGGWTSIIIGAVGTAFWPLISSHFPIKIDPLFPVFSISLSLSWVVTQITSRKSLSHDNYI